MKRIIEIEFCNSCPKFNDEDETCDILKRKIPDTSPAFYSPIPDDCPLPTSLS